MDQKTAKTGVAETFDEHEKDTTPRAYPKGIVEGTRRTAKMAAFHGDGSLRTESGTRPTINQATLEAHARAKIEDTFHASIAASRAEQTSEDAHSRPTIEIGVMPFVAPSPVVPEHAVTPVPVLTHEATPLAHEPTPVAAHEARSLTPRTFAPEAPKAGVSISRRAITLVLIGVVVLILAASAAAFFFGRPHR